MSWDGPDDSEKERKRRDMITAVDKALVTGIASVFTVSNAFGWTHLSGDTVQAVNTLVATALPFLVYFWPNKA